MHSFTCQPLLKIETIFTLLHFSFHGRAVADRQSATDLDLRSQGKYTTKLGKRMWLWNLDVRRGCFVCNSWSVAVGSIPHEVGTFPETRVISLQPRHFILWKTTVDKILMRWLNTCWFLDLLSSTCDVQNMGNSISYHTCFLQYFPFSPSATLMQHTRKMERSGQHFNMPNCGRC